MERSQSYSNFEARAAGGSNEEQPKAYAGSIDNLPAAMEEHFPPHKPLRKRKKLQRQPTALDVQDDDDLDFECSAYNADLEDEVPPQAPTRTRAHIHALALQRHISCRSSSSGSCLRHEDSFDSCSTAPELSPRSQRQHRFSSLLLRDSSLSVQSDSSRYSSVDSLLESRKPDPEAILINLGFGPVGSEDMLSRIPKRFLKPSQVPGIDTEAFVQRLTLASSLADSSVLGYRGLTGNPDMPPSSIVAKIMQRFEVNNQRKKSMGSIEHTIR